MKTALITGASSGIGNALAKIFASKKAQVVLVARQEEKLKDLALELEKKYAIKAFVLATDLSTEAGVQSLFKYCEAEHLKIDYLVNNAGFGSGGSFTSRPWETYGKMIDLNIKSLTQLCHYFIPKMEQNGFGRVMNVASTAGFLPGPNMAVYFASKAYVLHFTEALNMELAHSKVTVTALCPGPTDTAFQDVADLQNTKLFRPKHLFSAEDVASFGFKAMMNGWRVAIPGWKNMILAKTARIAPRSWVMRIAKDLNSKISN